MKKYYVVREGREKGIFDTWEKCKESIEGYSGAEYKSFKSLDEAKSFLDNGSSNDKHITNKYSKSENALKAYVDGSYDSHKKIYSFGVVLITEAEIIKYSKTDNNPKFISMRNIAGEVLGAMYAMKYAFEHNYRKLVIYHDYEGISKWPESTWKAKNELTQKYVKYYNTISNKVKINFIKVQAHSGDYYNEIADQLAKAAIENFEADNRDNLNKKNSRHSLVSSKITQKKIEPNINFIIGDFSIDYISIFDVFKKQLKDNKLYLKDIKDIYISYNAINHTIIFDVDFKDSLNKIFEIYVSEMKTNEKKEYIY